MNVSRRQFHRRALLTLGTGFLSNTTLFTQPENLPLMMPDEAHLHTCTWMAFGAQQRIWGRELLSQVQRNIALLASTIARFEPVRMLVRPDEIDLARDLLNPDTPHPIELIPAPLDDVWVRDTGPTFVITNDDKLVAVDFNFNGWGGRQEHAADAQVAGRIAQLAGAQLQETTLVLEGGGIEVDGDGTALVTESCILNDNRNPGVSKAEMESQLGPLLGVEKFIWLPGLRGHDITDGHIDFYARFTSPGHIIAALDSDPESPDYNITRTHLDLLRDATDAKGRSLKIQTLRTPETIRPDFASDDFAAGFIGYYVCNDAVIIQEFGDHAADTAAREIIQSAYPDREVIALNMDALATGGGSIHCVTQQQPSLNSAH